MDIMTVLVGFARLKLDRFESIMKITIMLSAAGVDTSKVLNMLPLISSVYDGMINGQVAPAEKVAQLESLVNPKKEKREYTKAETDAYNKRILEKAAKLQANTNTTVDNNTNNINTTKNDESAA